MDWVGEVSAGRACARMGVPGVGSLGRDGDEEGNCETGIGWKEDPYFRVHLAGVDWV